MAARRPASPPPTIRTSYVGLSTTLAHSSNSEKSPPPGKPWLPSMTRPEIGGGSAAAGSVPGVRGEHGVLLGGGRRRGGDGARLHHPVEHVVAPAPGEVRVQPRV